LTQEDQKPSWPQTPEGVTDWEAVFEAPDTGLIPMVEKATTSPALREITTVIIFSLFTRDSDAVIKVKYASILEDILPEDSEPLKSKDHGFIQIQSDIVELLIRIKKHRLEKIVEYLAKKKTEGIEATKSTAPEPEKDLRTEVKQTERTAEEFFSDVVCEMFESRFTALQTGIDQDSKPVGEPLPYLLSAAFAERFIKIVKTHFIEVFAEEMRPIISRCAIQAEDKRFAALSEAMRDTKNQAYIKESWISTWRRMTAQQEIPKEPEGASKGVISSFFEAFKDDDELDFDDDELTPEEWGFEVERIQKDNVRSRKVWEVITKPSPAYEAPTDEDSEILRELLTRGSQGILKEKNAILQMAKQGGDKSAFEKYQLNKDIDMALLAACYTEPKLFLGDKGLLKPMLSFMLQDELEERYELVSFFLGDLLGLED